MVLIRCLCSLDASCTGHPALFGLLLATLPAQAQLDPHQHHLKMMPAPAPALVPAASPAPSPMDHSAPSHFDIGAPGVGGLGKEIWRDQAQEI